LFEETIFPSEIIFKETEDKLTEKNIYFILKGEVGVFFERNDVTI
jgi:hypothetical protein